MTKLTTTAVESLKGTGRTKYEPVALGGSLVARGLANKVQYYYQYWDDGKKSRCPLGEHSRDGDRAGGADSTAYSLAGARARAIALAALQKQHGNLIGHMREQRVTAREAVKIAKEARETHQQETKEYSLKSLCTSYWKHLEADGKASAKDVRNGLRLWVIEKHPTLANRKASEVTTDNILTILRTIIEAGHTTTTNRVRSYLNAAYTFGLGSATDPLASSRAKGFRLTSNPVAPVKRVASFETAGERVLTSHEIGGLLRRLEAIDKAAARAVILSIRLGGQRITQLLAATKADYDPEAHTITLRDGKGRRTQPRLHVLPVVETTVPIITQALANPHPLRPGLYGGLTTETVSKQVREISKEMEKNDGIAPFCWRDLRRTCETMLAKMGISKDLRAQIQSRGLSGIQDRHYDKHQYIEEKCAALQAWNDRLDSITADSPGATNVVASNQACSAVSTSDDIQKGTAEPTYTIEKTREKIVINQRERGSLVETHTIVYDSPEAGWRAASSRNQTHREELFEKISSYEELVDNILKSEGYERKRAKKIDYIETEKGSLHHFIFNLERQIDAIRRNIEQFENFCSDEKSLNRYYQATIDAIDLAHDLQALTIKRNEKYILRGEDKSYNHTGRTTNEQRKIVRRVEQLMLGDNPLGITAAIKEIKTRDKIEVSESTIFSWMKKHSK